MKITVLKRKCRGFFKPEDVPIIHQAVHDVHSIISNASILLRSYLIECFDKGLVVEVDKELVKQACTVIQGSDKDKTRGPRKKSSEANEEVKAKKLEESLAKREVNKKSFNDMNELNKRLYGSSLIVKSDLSISHILEYSITTLITAYANNISQHFFRYPKKYMKCDMINKGVDQKQAGKNAAILSNYFYYEQTTSSVTFPSNIQELLTTYDTQNVYTSFYPLLTTVGEKPKPRCYEVDIFPWIYLQQMIRINKLFETEFPKVEEYHRKLYNPLPFHSSFVPMCIRIDTSGLLQLLMTQQRINEFKNYYKLTQNINYELNIPSKKEVCSSFEKIHGRKAKDKHEEGLYATEEWAFLTNLRSCKQWKELHNLEVKGTKMVFDNSIVTNGVIICFQMIDSASSGRKEPFKKKKTEDKPKKSKDKKSNKEQADEEKPKIQPPGEGEKGVANDPGKVDIATITDGITTLTYTAKQRDDDTYRKALEKESMRLRNMNNLGSFESKELSKYCSKSCDIKIFSQYVKLRSTQRTAFEQTYRKTFFRQANFTRYCRRKSSEEKFINKVKETFSKANPNADSEEYKALTEKMRQNAKKENCELVLGYGNWGQNPNALKGCQPTPGIGIRRRFEGRFKRVETIDERGTSQGCPCCHCQKSLKKVRIGDVEIHHLLRCSNEDCLSRLWNRNVAGSINILDRFLESRSVEEYT